MNNLRTSECEVLSQDALNKEKALIKEALELKKRGGSIVPEKVSCGKRSCKKCGGFRRTHGPYSYLHYYDASCPWKVRKRYLGKDVAEMLRCPEEDLVKRLREIEVRISLVTSQTLETCPKKVSLWDRGEL
jgi:hypothetical protein